MHSQLLSDCFVLLEQIVVDNAVKLVLVPSGGLIDENPMYRVCDIVEPFFAGASTNILAVIVAQQQMHSELLNDGGG